MAKSKYQGWVCKLHAEGRPAGRPTTDVVGLYIHLGIFLHPSFEQPCKPLDAGTGSPEGSCVGEGVPVP